jgi:hypothetical protein
MRRSFLLALLAFAVACIFMAATPAMAVHKGADDLRCGACHTMHSSQGNNTAIGGATGSLILLRGGVDSRANIHLLCLDCHSDEGSQDTTVFTESSTAPKVHFDADAGDGPGDNSAEPFDFTKLGAAGDFGEVFTYDGSGVTLGTGDESDDYSLGHGHSLGATGTTPPGAAESAVITLSCTNCHDSHGTATTTSAINAYRNLKTQPVGGGGGTSTDTDGSVTLFVTTPWGGASATDDFKATNSDTDSHYWPIYNGTTSNVYSAGSDDLNGGMSGWCAQCHDNWHEDQVATNSASSDWRRHPVHNQIVDTNSASGVGVVIINWTHYKGDGVSTAQALNSADGTKLPASQGSADEGQYYADDTDDMVFCLSCHFAHGGPYYDALRWNYTSSVDSTGQGGRRIASNVGCQQCHNR